MQTNQLPAIGHRVQGRMGVSWVSGVAGILAGIYKCQKTGKLFARVVDKRREIGDVSSGVFVAYDRLRRPC